MKIELKDRDYWIKICKRALFWYRFRQQYSDAWFENNWHDKWLCRGTWQRALFGPQTPFPPEGYHDGDFSFSYPSFKGELWIDTITTLSRALNDDSTGVIFVDDNLYDVLSSFTSDQ